MWPPNHYPYRPSVPPVIVPTPGQIPPLDTRADADDEGDDEGVIPALRKRLIRFDTLDRPARILLLVAFAQLGVAGFLLGTRNLPQIQIVAGVSANLSENTVPLVAFVVTTLSLGLGFACALSGALLVRASLRLLIVALVTAAMGVEPLFGLLTGSSPSGTAVDVVTALWGLQVAVLVAIWVWALGSLLIKAKPRPAVFSAPAHPHSFPTRSFSVALGLIIVYYAAEFGIWLVFSRAGIPIGVGLFAEDVTLQLLVLPFILAVIVYWSSTDFLEWGEVAARALLRGTRAITSTLTPWPLIILTGAAAAAMAADVLRGGGDELLVSLVIVAVVIGLGVAAVHAANIDSTWPEKMPVAGQILAPTFLFASLTLAIPAGELLARVVGQPIEVGDSLYLMMSLMVDLAVLTAGLVLIVRARTPGRHATGAIGLYLFMVALLTLAGTLNVILGVAGLPGGNLSFHFLSGLKLLVALSILGAVIWLVANRRMSWSAAGLLAAGFLLLAGLQTVSWFFNLTDAISVLGALSPVLFALLFLLAVCWDLLTSGEQVTNQGSMAYPRMGRILIYVGYTLVSSAILLFSATVRYAPGSALAPDQPSPDTDVQLGLLLLGIPLVLCSAALRLGRWRAKRRLAMPTAPRAASAESSTTAQVAIVAVGTLAIVAMALFTAVQVVPRATGVTHAKSLAVYRARVPGPGCDSGAAQWTHLPSAGTITCLPDGMQMTVDANQTGLVGFNPPSSTFPENYRAAVRVDVNGLPEGCISIAARFGDKGFYLLGVCTDGGWQILRFTYSDNKVVILKASKLPPERTYNLEATTDGATQTLSIDGTVVGQVSDATLQGGYVDLQVNNTGTQAGSVVFSDFVFTPLA